ncbi:uncharacterized protein si:dkey-118j18.2 isoform X1 [Trematomus bernacchii]|uniref:uncharacterized protein si:dkey-118j18.2 isoform X1 n=1 Tax=Trematomus bernacchii TaxID=40690 RepID=UPI001469C6BB|nr:uncharacterized protein si:dkey-118j18.2 isoform X1 [Trematomus bernacchii]XP_033988365.1 uncharacterized protein si:dkey-118j18.2 isoform X1 [Trematomus bernacchii]XP_033988366.1 uncharacterized protein si:dkey-118j18.2 isoform X1 [Trematomus bernacchii]
MELYWYIVVIVFIVIKICFYVCWYRSRQRQLAAYLNNPRNAQIVIVGGRAYLHQMYERQSQTSVWPSWYGAQDDLSTEEPSATALPPDASFSQLDMPPPYEAVSGEDDLKPPPYSECAHHDEADAPRSPHHTVVISEGDTISINEAPPPYTLSPPAVSQPDVPVNHNESESRPN